MNIVENIQNYFRAKSDGNETLKAPEGVCPNCWGRQNWEGEFYKKMKANKSTPDSNIYNNFIHEVVEKLDKITLKEDTYTCETCNIKYDQKH